MVIVVIMVIMVIKYQLRRTSQPASEAADIKTFVIAPEGHKDLALGPPVCRLLTLRRRIKSHLLFAGIIRSSPFSLR